MERLTRFRVGILLVALALVVGGYVLTMFQLQVVETGGKPSDNMSTFTTMTRVKAARGDILDRNGNVLVGSRASYDLTINNYVLNSSPDRHAYIFRLTELCREMGVQYNDHFPISKTRPFVYTLEQQDTTWQGYFQTYIAEMGLDSDISAPLLMERLREAYRLPEEWTDEQARAVIGIRYEMSLRGLTNLPTYVFLSDATDEERLAILELNVPGMSVEPTVEREYYTECAAHILGYTGPMDAEEWEYYSDLNYSMDADVGKSGLELAMEEYLHGTDGWRVDVFTEDGTVIDSYYTQEPKAGNNVVLTIDLRIQEAAEKALADQVTKLRAQEEGKTGQDVEGASAVVLDTRTGEVLACASYPSYSPAEFFDKYEELLEDPYKPLINRALEMTYPPGSTFKPNMVVAAIDSGVINSGTQIVTKGIFTKYADSDFAPACMAWTYGGGTHGTLDATHALQVSCNYFFYELGDRITDDMKAVDDTSKAMGLGESTGVEIWEETGHRANPETKTELYGDDAGWYKADQIMAAIGQSDNSFTPMQLAVYASTLANRGTRYKVTFLKQVVASDYTELVFENSKKVANVLEISDDAYLTYTEGMYLVCNSVEGSGWESFGSFPVTVAGKTGTAQHGIPNASDHSAFICFAPYEAPEVAVATYFERGGYGADSTNVAKEILEVYFADSINASDSNTTDENVVS